MALRFGHSVNEFLSEGEEKEGRCGFRPGLLKFHRHRGLLEGLLRHRFLGPT